MFRFTLRTKFIFVLLGLGVLPMLLIGWAGFYLSQETILRQAGHIQQQSLQQNAISLDEKLTMMQNLAGSLIREEAIRSMLLPGASPKDLKQYGHEWDQFVALISKHTFLNFKYSPVITIYGYNGKGFSSWVSGGESIYALLQKNKPFQNLLKTGKSSKFYWSAPHEDFSGSLGKLKAMSYIAAFMDPTSGQEWGKIVVSMSIPDFFSILSEDESLNMVYTSGGSQIYSSLAASFPIQALPATAISDDGLPTMGFAENPKDDGKVLYVSQPLKSGWHIVKVVPYHSLLRDLIQIRYILLGFVGLAVVMSIVLGHLFIGRIVRPVRQFVHLMKQVGHGHWDDDSRIQADPEIGILHGAFRQMTDDLKMMQDHMQRQERVKLELELKALLSQIQPHFIKNTLAAINGLALQGKMEDIQRLVDSLGFFLSSRIYPDRPIVPLAEELLALEHYLKIMRIRYPDKFEVIFEVPESLRSQSIVRFALQPIVENAIYHGMRSDDVLHIWIQAYDVEDVCMVVVMDNGKGTNKKPLSIRHDEEELAGTIPHLSGIGLHNIDQRIRLYFGADFGLRFESALDSGTQVEILLPKQKMEDGR
jgi:sensor histidine kinase YesM